MASNPHCQLALVIWSATQLLAHPLFGQDLGQMMIAKVVLLVLLVALLAICGQPPHLHCHYQSLDLIWFCSDMALSPHCEVVMVIWSATCCHDHHHLDCRHLKMWVLLSVQPL